MKKKPVHSKAARKINARPFRLTGHSILAKASITDLPAPEDVVFEAPKFFVVRWEHRVMAPAPAQPPSRRRMSSREKLKRAMDFAVRFEPVRGIETGSLAGRASNALLELARRTREGDGHALWAFARMVCRAAEELSRITAAKPENLKPVARHLLRWPLMRSRNPRLSDPRQWLKDIGLGTGRPIVSDEVSKWKLDAAAEAAMDLIDYMTKTFALTPPLTREHAAHWWPIAKAALLNTYQDPVRVPELAAMVTAPTRKLSPGRKREAILSTIRARFEAMLPETAPPYQS